MQIRVLVNIYMYTYNIYIYIKIKKKEYYKKKKVQKNFPKKIPKNSIRMCVGLFLSTPHPTQVPLPSSVWLNFWITIIILIEFYTTFQYL